MHCLLVFLDQASDNWILTKVHCIFALLDCQHGRGNMPGPRAHTRKRNNSASTEMKNRTKIEKPIFMVGCARGGTSLVYRLLATHPQAAWFSNWTSRLPSQTWLAILSRLADPFPVTLRNITGWPSPEIEAHQIYKRCGIHELHERERRPITSRDVPAESSAQFRDIICRHLKWQGKPRFVHKNVNNSYRIAYLHEVFPDARFIHVVRDGRAVAMSLLNAWFWGSYTLWWCGKRPGEIEAEGVDPLVICGSFWRRTVRAVTAAAADLPPDQFMQVRYEDFVAAPEKWISQIFDFCELQPNSRFKEMLRANPVRNMNGRWQDRIPAASVDRLWREIQNTALDLGYD